MQDRALLFRGKTLDDKKHICIKFVQRYGKDMHICCADEGFAPNLIAFETLLGGWYMVVMDFLDRSWRPFEDIDMTSKWTNTARLQLKQKMHAALVKLHQHHMVHGDLRDTNVLVKHNSGEFMLIDYDWAGTLGTARYPRLVNKSDVLGRPKDVEDGELISTQHDIHMLEHLFNTRKRRKHKASRSDVVK